jgi:hypothetical protein
MMSAEGRNKYQKWIDLATMIDAWRIFPRVFICTYIYLLYTVVIWFMALPDPNMNQAGLVSVVVGAGAAWFGLYTQSKPKMQDSAPAPVMMQPAPVMMQPAPQPAKGQPVSGVGPI